MRKQRFVLATLVALAASTAAHAHHSGAQFDPRQTATVEGTVQRFEWANPHVYIFLEQTAEDGKKVQWTIEGIGPGPLRRLGWTQNTLVAGDAIAVTGSLARSGTKTMNLLSLRKGGEVLYEAQGLVGLLSTANDAPAAAAAGLDGVWATLLSMDVVVRLAVAPKGAVPLTAAGDAAFASYDEARMSPVLACVPQPAPFFMFVPDLKRITTREKTITIAGDYDAAERTIHLDALDHSGATPTQQGHSIGRWEGDTLVIDTVQFASYRIGNAWGVPSGEQKHLVERLTRNATGASLTYEFELTDPEFLAAPVTGKVEWAYRPGLELERETCNPETARRFSIQ